MLDIRDICSLSDFQRNAKSHLVALKKSRRPKVLTINGAAEVVVQDAAAYQELLTLADRARTDEAIRRGIAEFHAGKGRPLKAAMKDLGSKYEANR